MKDFIFAVVFLLAITVCISSCGEIVPSEQTPIDGWSVANSDCGDISVGKGESGEVNVFALSAETAPKNTAEVETEQRSPITVSVEQPKHKPVWEYVLDGVTITLLVEVIILSLITIALWLKRKKIQKKGG